MRQSNLNRFFRLTIERDYGEDVQAVGSCLLSHGSQSLRSLQQRLEDSLPRNQVSKSLLVLVNQGVVTVDTKKIPAEYGIEWNMVHYRIYYSEFVLHVSESYGEMGASIIEAFCKHHRLTQASLITLAKAYYANKEAQSAEQKEIDTEFKKCFRKLVKSRYIRRADTLQMNYAKDVHVPRKRKIGMQPVVPVVQGKRKKTVIGFPKPIALSHVEIINEHTFYISNDDDDESVCFSTLSLSLLLH
ncbi:hypothetical protein AAMO2058_001666800 [Amorphochlora amoebiformis]